MLFKLIRFLGFEKLPSTTYYSSGEIEKYWCYLFRGFILFRKIREMKIEITHSVPIIDSLNECLTMKHFCLRSIKILNKTNNSEWATLFIEIKLKFFNLYQKKHSLIFSTVHGIDFFQNVLDCLNGIKWEEKGQYGDNFRKLIQINNAASHGN